MHCFCDEQKKVIAKNGFKKGLLWPDVDVKEDIRNNIFLLPTTIVMYTFTMMSCLVFGSGHRAQTMFSL